MYMKGEREGEEEGEGEGEGEEDGERERERRERGRASKRERICMCMSVQSFQLLFSSRTTFFSDFHISHCISSSADVCVETEDATTVKLILRDATDLRHIKDSEKCFPLPY